MFNAYFGLGKEYNLFFMNIYVIGITVNTQ